MVLTSLITKPEKQFNNQWLHPCHPTSLEAAGINVERIRPLKELKTIFQSIHKLMNNNVSMQLPEAKHKI